MQKNIRYHHLLRVLLTATALMTLGGGFMGMYGIFTQLQAWEADPVSVVVAILLTVLLLVGGGCLFRRGIRYDGRTA